MKIRHSITIVTLLVSFALLPDASYAQKAWSYQGSHGPNDWGDLNSAYATCSTEHPQSPIDIKGAKKSDLSTLKLDYKVVTLDIIDNGHSIQVNYAPGSTLTVGDKTYELKQFRFHHPSEEHVNGHGYDMVAHLVHADANGHLAVIAVFLKKGQSNAFLDTIWKTADKEEAVDGPGVSLNANDLLPAKHEYYTFGGSLSTPPCLKGVTCDVLKEPVSLSGEQVNAFAKIYPDNARPVQPTNGCEISGIEIVE